MSYSRSPPREPPRDYQGYDAEYGFDRRPRAFDRPSASNSPYGGAGVGGGTDSPYGAGSQRGSIGSPFGAGGAGGQQRGGGGGVKEYDYDAYDAGGEQLSSTGYRQYVPSPGVAAYSGGGAGGGQQRGSSRSPYGAGGAGAEYGGTAKGSIGAYGAGQQRSSVGGGAGSQRGSIGSPYGAGGAGGGQQRGSVGGGGGRNGSIGNYYDQQQGSGRYDYEYASHANTNSGSYEGAGRPPRVEDFEYGYERHPTGAAGVGQGYKEYAMRTPSRGYGAVSSDYGVPKEYGVPAHHNHQPPPNMPPPAAARGAGGGGWEQREREQQRPSISHSSHGQGGGGGGGGRQADVQETDILGDDSDVEGEQESLGRQHMPEGQAADDACSSSEDESADPEFLDLMEREQIIAKYDQGPDRADIDEWENPDDEVYTKTDRFGFVHKKGVSAEELKKQRIQRELKREKKWLVMLQAWHEGRPVKKLKERIWKGVPEKVRMVVWPRLLEAERLSQQHDGMYAELLLRARLMSKDIKQIDLDINRTYRDHHAFRRRYDVKQQSLMNVLLAYSMYNTEVGYCQGMSQIAALFLMYLNEEETFWCLHQIMIGKKWTMHGFFVPGFPKLSRFEAHFKAVLKKYRPRVYKHLDKQDIPYIYLTKWWFGCFLDRVPFSLALRIWDVYLIEGDVVLIAMALNVMKMHEKTIRKLQIENFMEFVQTTIADNFGFSDDETMFSLHETLGKLKSDGLASPPPPQASDLAEVPTKALAPILLRPLAEIRADVAEIQSRCSRRGHSLGRSPAPPRRPTGSGKKAAGGGGGGGMGGGGMSNNHSALAKRDSTASSVNRRSSSRGENGSLSQLPAVDGQHVPFEVPKCTPSVRRHPDQERERLPAERTDSVRSNRSSFRSKRDVDRARQDLLARNEVMRDEQSGRMVRLTREDSRNRVQHTNDNVTYVAVGESDDDNFTHTVL